MGHLELPNLRPGLADVRLSPHDAGRVELVVRRPADDQHELLTEAELSCDTGLVGTSGALSTQAQRRTRRRS